MQAFEWIALAAAIVWFIGNMVKLLTSEDER